jgi:hypothetical protein
MIEQKNKSKTPFCTNHCVPMERDGSRWVCGEPGCDIVCWNGATSTPADAPTRAMRARAHRAFDPIWKMGAMSRIEAYEKLAKFMDLDLDETHIGMFRFEQCWKVLDFVESVSVRFSDEVKVMSALSSIGSSRKIRPPRIILLGGPKVGKSTFASEFNAPVFQPIEKEEGIDDVDAQTFPVARSFAEVLENFNALDSSDHNFKTLVLDSASALQPLVVKRAMEIEKVESEAKLGGGFGRQYDTVLLLWSQLMGAIDNLRDRGIATIIIGHITQKRFEDPINGGYTRYDFDVAKPVAEQVQRWADAILFASWDVYRKSEESGFNKQEQRGTGSGRRVLYTQARPAHPGGGRGVYGKLPYELEFKADVFRDSVKAALAEERANKAAEKESVAPVVVGIHLKD